MQGRATKDIGVHGSAFLLHRIRHGLALNSGLVREGRTGDGAGVKRGRNALITDRPFRKPTTDITGSRASTTGRVLALPGIHVVTPQRGAARKDYKTI